MEKQIAHLIEELNEASKAAAQLLRFGVTSFNPKLNVMGLEHLETELGHVKYAMDKLTKFGLLRQEAIDNSYLEKVEELDFRS